MAEAFFETLPRSDQPIRAGLPDAARPDALRSLIEAAVSVVFAIDIARLRSESRGRARVAQARQVAMYLSHCAFGLTHTDVGRVFNRDRTTVAHACALVEDRRDDPDFDRTLANLEEIVCRLAAVSGFRREF